MATAANPPAAEATKVETPPAPVPGTPEYDQAMIARAAKASGETPADSSATPARPAWLPEKFQTPEAMAAAYKELESKQGVPKTVTPPVVPPTKEAAQADVAKAGLDWDALNTEFAEKGVLSEETYTKLAEKGLDKRAVDTYIEGQKAIAARYDNAAAEAAGGAEPLKAMLTWAGTAMSPDEAAAFNEATASGNEARMKLAISGLRARYEASEGKAPKLITGDGKVATDGQGFASLQELSRAQRDPRYKTDPAYRKQIEARVAATTAF